MFVRSQRQQQPQRVRFGNVELGHAFRYDGDTYIKLSDSNYNCAYRLGGDYASDFPTEMLVEPVIVKFTVHALPKRLVKD